MNWIKTISQFVFIVPVVIQLVITLVKLFEKPGNGKEKKEAVLKMVKMIYDSMARFFNLTISYEVIETISNQTIEIVVSFFNLVGIFKKQKEDQN